MKDMNKLSENAISVLHITAFGSSLEIADIFIKNGADVNAHNKDGWTPLHFAAMTYNLPVMDSLYKNGAIDYASGPNRLSAFDLLKMHCRKDPQIKDIVNKICTDAMPFDFQECLAKIKTDKVDSCDAIEAKYGRAELRDTGWREIHSYALKGDLDSVIKLVNQGVDVNTQTKSGWTAVHMAGINADFLMMEVLQKANADITIVGGKGQGSVVVNPHDYQTLSVRCKIIEDETPCDRMVKMLNSICMEAGMTATECVDFMPPKAELEERDAAIMRRFSIKSHNDPSETMIDSFFSCVTSISCVTGFVQTLLGMDASNDSAENGDSSL